MNKTVLESKQKVVSEISTKMKEAGSIVVAEYRGLSVAEVTELRRALRAEDVELKVYKNTLASLATKESGYEELNESLTGPNAIAFAKDATAAARVLAKFAKDHEALVIKNGVVEGKVVDNATVMELSALPNREGMLSMLLSCLQSPVRSFACAVKAVSDKKAEAGE